MSVVVVKQLHWTQRVALVRHNLHTASRSGDFTFFKNLQAAGLMEGTNHAATLTATIGDDADSLLAAMDDLNSGLAYIHQDAFKTVYDNLKNSMRDADKDEDKSKLYVDIVMQKNMADMAIDKMSNSAVALINQQPDYVQDTAANTWITGVIIVADAIQITFKELSTLEHKLNDFIQLEESWNSVKAALVTSVTALKGVFFLMDPNNPLDPNRCSSSPPKASTIASAGGAMFRRISNAFISHPESRSSSGSSSSSTIDGSSPTSRSGSIASQTSNFNMMNFNRNGSISSLSSASGGGSRPVYRDPTYVRNSVSAGCPTSMPANTNWGCHTLDTIPPTPAAGDVESADPFDTSMPPMPDMPTMSVIDVAPMPLESGRISMAVQ